MQRDDPAQERRLGARGLALPQPGNWHLEGDDFCMYTFKVAPCPLGYRHDWSLCPLAHAGERAIRRDPRRYCYSGLACREAKESGSCKRGDACPFAHSAFEFWLHPSRYLTAMCNQGASCRRSFCFFAHSVSELRTPTLRPGDVCPEALAAAASPTAPQPQALAAGTSAAAPQQPVPSHQGMQPLQALGMQPHSSLQLPRSSQMQQQQQQQQQQLGSPRQLAEVRRWPASSGSMQVGDTGALQAGGSISISLGSSGRAEPSFPGGALPLPSALGQQPAVPGGSQQPTAEAASRLHARALAARDAQQAQVRWPPGAGPPGHSAAARPSHLPPSPPPKAASMRSDGSSPAPALQSLQGAAALPAWQPGQVPLEAARTSSSSPHFLEAGSEVQLGTSTRWAPQQPPLPPASSLSSDGMPSVEASLDGSNPGTDSRWAMHALMAVGQAASLSSDSTSAGVGPAQLLLPQGPGPLLGPSYSPAAWQTAGGMLPPTAAYLPSQGEESGLSVLVRTVAAEIAAGRCSATQAAQLLSTLAPDQPMGVLLHYVEQERRAAEGRR